MLRLSPLSLLPFSSPRTLALFLNLLANLGNFLPPLSTFAVFSSWARGRFYISARLNYAVSDASPLTAPLPALFSPVFGIGRLSPVCFSFHWELSLLPGVIYAHLRQAPRSHLHTRVGRRRRNGVRYFCFFVRWEGGMSPLSTMTTRKAKER